MSKKIIRILLFMLPFMALVLATTGNSVELIHMETGEKITGSYFVMLNDSTVAFCPALAATCSIFSLAAALIHTFTNKPAVLRVSAWISFAGACLAVIPVAARGEYLLLPNVLFPILLLTHFVLCAFSRKLGADKREEPQGRRLEMH